MVATTVAVGPVTKVTGAAMLVDVVVAGNGVDDEPPPPEEDVAVVVVEVVEVVVVGGIVVVVVGGVVVVVDVVVVVVVVVGVALASAVMPRCTAFRAATRNSYVVPELNPDTVNVVAVFTPSFTVVHVEDDAARYCTT